MKQATIRLTTTLRDRIKNRILKETFTARETALEKERFAFGLHLYDCLYDNRTKAILNNLPEGFAPTSSTIIAQFGEASRGFAYVGLPESLRFADKHKGRCVLKFDALDSETKQFFALEERKDKLKQEKKALENKLITLLGSVTTLKKLHEVWPESAAYTEDLEPAPKMLPAILPAELNEAIAKGVQG